MAIGKCTSKFVDHGVIDRCVSPARLTGCLMCVRQGHGVKLDNPPQTPHSHAFERLVAACYTDSGRYPRATYPLLDLVLTFHFCLPVEIQTNSGDHGRRHHQLNPYTPLILRSVHPLSSCPSSPPPLPPSPIQVPRPATRRANKLVRVLLRRPPPRPIHRAHPATAQSPRPHHPHHPNRAAHRGPCLL